MGSGENEGGGVRAIAELARQGRDVATLKTEDGREFAALVDPSTGGQVLHELTSSGWRPPLAPTIEEDVRLSHKDSFVEYVNAYKTPTARLFAALNDGGGGSIVCELDYHAAGSPTLPDAQPGRRKHRVTYQLRDSEEWTRWSGISGRLKPQADFLRWLEENGADVEQPSGADLLELVHDFSVKRKVDFRSAVRLQNGDTSFEYAQTAEAASKSGEIAVPSKFVLRIPVFFGEPSMQVFAFLRYNIDEGLKLGIELHRPIYVRQALFQEIGADIALRCGVPLHYGAASSR